mgnify:CR=1 FL=1
MGKGFMDFFDSVDADIFCLQEIKLSEGQIEWNKENYYSYWNYAEKKGYSGTAVFSKEKPLSVKYGIGIDEHDHEGRVITLEFENFYMVTVYTPNSQRELTRLEYRMKWEDDFRNFLNDLRKNKPVVVTGDMNVAHKEIDLKNPKTNRKNAGFTDEERQKMTELLDSGFIDTFRYFYPDVEQKYSWWSYMFKSREKNARAEFPNRRFLQPPDIYFVHSVPNVCFQSIFRIPSSVYKRARQSFRRNKAKEGQSGEEKCFFRSGQASSIICFSEKEVRSSAVASNRSHSRVPSFKAVICTNAFFFSCL